MFQSTRPRGTRLPRGTLSNKEHYVSIHASARDATSVAISSPPSCCFNPRVRAGRDYRAEPSVCAGRVSIHASARDATG